MSHKYREGDRVRIKASPYPGALDNGKLGTVTKVTELCGETRAVYVLPDDTAQRSIRTGGSWCLYPHEIEPAPGVEELGCRSGLNVSRTVTGRIRVPIQPENLSKVQPRSKWETPGKHYITSYRSFRRYKAAGAAFGVIPFDPVSGRREADPVNVSVSVARRRAQAGLSLVAIVSEVQA